FCSSNTATPHIFPLSLHDALPIFSLVPMPVSPLPFIPPKLARGLGKMVNANARGLPAARSVGQWRTTLPDRAAARRPRNCCRPRSEEHTSELQSRENLVCRLLLEK